MSFDPLNWLDIWNIFEFEVVGGFYLAVTIGAIFVAYFCAKYDCPFQLTIIILCFYALIISAIKVGSNLLIYAFVVLAIGAITYYLLTKVFKRG